MSDTAIPTEKLSDLVSHAPAVLFLLSGPEHRFIIANGQYRQLVGRDPVGRTVAEALPEVAEQGFVALLDGVYTTGESYVGTETEVWLDRGGPERERTIWNFVYQATRASGGAIDGIAVHAIEVTELVQARQAAERSEARFRLLFDAMPQLGWTARADGFIDFYNRGWYDYTGTTHEQMQGWGWKSVHDPDLVDLVTARWQRSIDSGAPFEMEFPLRRHDGVFRTFLTRANPVRHEDGRIRRWVGVNTDVEDIRSARALAEVYTDQSRAATALIRDLRLELEAARARVAELESR